MLLDGLELLGNTDAANFAVDAGTQLLSTGKPGQLFYLYGNDETIGLYAFTGSEWRRVGASEFKLIPGDGINFDKTTGVISSTIPVNATENQILATRNGSLVWVTFTKADVGLNNVNNTSDANKPISIATQSALDQKVDKNNAVFDGEVVGISKSNVGLGNVDNTSDANKPISIATQDALDLKADIESPTFTGVVSGITSAMVGLGNVNNTTDLNKPISTATQTALNLKADKTYVDSGLSTKVNNVTYTNDINNLQTTIDNLTSSSDAAIDLKADKAYVDDNLDLKANIASPTFTGVVGGITKGMVGLGNVDNTTDLNKPVSLATQTALDLKADKTYVDNGLALKANIASPTFTGVVGGITKGMVGLSNVDNTSDINKPISTATQSALDLTEKKANKNVANGYVGLDVNLKINPAYLPNSSGSGIQSITGTQTDAAGNVSIYNAGIGIQITGTATAPIISAYTNYFDTGLFAKIIKGFNNIDLTLADGGGVQQTMLSLTPNKAIFYKGIQETIVSANISFSYTFNADASMYDLTLSNSTTYTFPNPGTNKGFQFTLIQRQTGARTVTWPNSVKWPGGTAPTITATSGKADVFSFVSDGLNWIGFPCGYNFTL